MEIALALSVMDFGRGHIWASLSPERQQPSNANGKENSSVNGLYNIIGQYEQYSRIFVIDTQANSLF